MALISTLTDDFNTADTSKWVNKATGGAWNAYESVSNGELVLLTTVNYDAELISVNTYDIASSAFFVQATARALTPGANEAEFNMFMQTADNTYVGFSLIGDGKIYCFQVLNGTTRTSFFKAIDIAATPFIRCRHASGRFYWEKSENATSWTAITNAAVYSGMPTTGMRMSIQAGHWGTHDPMTDKLAAFNMVHVPPSSGPPKEGQFFAFM